MLGIHMHVSIAITCLAGSILAFASAGTSTPSYEDILFEAAKKRFKLNSVVAQKDGTTKALKVVPDDLKMSYISLLKNQLAVEKMKKDPASVAKISKELFAKQPKIIQLSQDDGVSRHALIKDSRACNFTKKTSFHLAFKDLAKTLCMDMTFDYPGGFDETRRFKAEVLPIAKRSEFAAISEEWDALVSERFKSAVAKEFVAKYKKDGRLTL